jgi:peptide/nickel transport system permease protein
MMLDQREDTEQLARVRAKYGFDKPALEQYALYLNDLSVLSWHSLNKNDFTHLKKYANYKVLVPLGSGQIVLKAPHLRASFKSEGKPVAQIIKETLPNTMVLAIASICLAMLLGVSLGVVSALNKGSVLDRLLTVGGTLGMSVPSFFSAILIAWLFGFLWANYTGLNMTGSLYAVDDYGEGIYLKWQNLILPAITLGIRPLGVVIQLTRSSLLEEMNQDYVRTALAKGLPLQKVVYKHALRNALNPVVTAASGWFASMLAGAVFVEYIFGWNGLGKQIVESLNQLDLPVVMGAVLVIGATFVFINFLVDIIYAWLDPRVRV